MLVVINFLSAILIAHGATAVNPPTRGTDISIGEEPRPNARGEMPMPIHAICPSLRCRRILELPESVRGHEVNCRYCGMHFRVPQIRRRPIRTHPQSILRADAFAARVIDDAVR